MTVNDAAIFEFFLKNSKSPEWRSYQSLKTIFGTRLDPNRKDVLVAFVVKQDPLPPVPAVQKEEPVYLGDKEPVPSATLSLALIIPEEFDKYELDTWRRGHVPIFRVKE